MYKWIQESGVQHIIVATKSDKVSRAEAQRNMKVIRETLVLPDDTKIFPVSSENRNGIKELWDAIDSYIVEEDEDE